MSAQFVYNKLKDNPEYLFVRTFFLNYKQELLNRGYNIRGFCRVHKISKTYFYACIAGTHNRPITIYKLGWLAGLLNCTIFDFLTPLDEEGNSINRLDK